MKAALRLLSSSENAQNALWALAFVVVGILVGLGKLKPETLEGLLFGVVARSALPVKSKNGPVSGGG